ncbi:MAG: FAD-binding oxidoreductase, partial [Candidatus Dormibacteraeota bacterium]|nr:FAD-binding oxidoreductase [Candidatus Dormibacteraeota bacterium]
RFALACRHQRYERALAALGPLASDSFQMHLGYASSGMRVGVTHRGAVLTWESEGTFEAGVRSLRAAGADLAELDASQIRELVPTLAHDVPRAVLDQNIAHCDSRRWTLAVAEAAVELGARIKRGMGVRRLLLSGGRVRGIATGDGDVAAGVTVLAAGVWTDRLLSGTGVRLTLEGGKGYHVDLAPEAGDPRLPVYLQDAHVVATPLEGRTRLAGTLDLTGLDTRIDQRRADAVVASVSRSLRGIRNRRPEEVWAGLRPCTSDGIPAIGATAAAEGLLIATGHAMIGLALAPVTGKLIAELASGAAPSHEVSALSPDRFRPAHVRRQTEAAARR